MNKGPIVTTVVAAFALAAVVGAFMTNASPYVTFNQAKSAGGDHLHVAGDIVKGSVRMDAIAHTLSFSLKDQDGTTVTVVHKGDPPANLQEATKVVAVGGMKGTDFVSHQLLVKCPSKYEGESAKSANPS